MATTIGLVIKEEKKVEAKKENKAETKKRK